ncbi:MAG: DUF4339 domain-containing protein [Bdellovibrionales bacterium]|nr:DUF4339 domain-containing protein [Bdellovibrionales bacterium]
MSDLEWYLDVGGKQSGPHSAREIVEMVRAGKIAATSQVTAARMNGDWVTAQDLIDAYDELYSKPAIAVPIASPTAAFSGPSDPNFTAPPRPTEQLERSKIITLNREEMEKAPDPTEALFQAIQAVREKAAAKNTGTSSTSSAAARDSFGAASRAGGSRIPPQLLFILSLAAILGIAIFVATKFLGGKAPEETTAKPAAVGRKTSEPAPPPPPARTGGLLNDQGGGTSAARTTPPVQPMNPMNRHMTGRGNSMHPPTRDDSRNTNMGGGARYRDERDERVEEEADVDESDVDAPREIPEPMPVDPSQVPADRIIPEPGTIPGQGALPGADPYMPPPAGVPPGGNP